MSEQNEAPYMTSRSIGIRDLKNGLTAVVRAVRDEQASYIITLHGRPVAVLRPFTPADAEALAARARDEERAGLRALSEAVTAAWESPESDVAILGRLHEATATRAGFVVQKGDQTYRVEMTPQPDPTRRFGALRGVTAGALSTDEIMALIRGAP